MFRQSCRECGHDLAPGMLCATCREHVSWVCGRCGRVDDCTHVHL